MRIAPVRALPPSMIAALAAAATACKQCPPFTSVTEWHHYQNHRRVQRSCTAHDCTNNCRKKSKSVTTRVTGLMTAAAQQ